jgi:hypothetical protein
VFFVKGYLAFEARARSPAIPELVILFPEPSDDAERFHLRIKRCRLHVQQFGAAYLPGDLGAAVLQGFADIVPAALARLGFREDRSSRIGRSRLRLAGCGCVREVEIHAALSRQNGGPFDRVLKLADIARPGILLQGLELSFDSVNSRRLATLWRPTKF